MLNRKEFRTDASSELPFCLKREFSFSRMFPDLEHCAQTTSWEPGRVLLTITVHPALFDRLEQKVEATGLCAFVQF